MRLPLLIATRAQDHDQVPRVLDRVTLDLKFTSGRRYPTHKGPGLDAGHAKSLGEQKQINRLMR